MSDNKKWEGKNKGGVRGQKFFVFILNFFGLQIAYFFLRFVAFYFFITAKSTKTSLKYFREILGYTGWKAYKATYQNYYIFGQTLLDKVALLAGMRNKFTIIHEGHDDNLVQLKNLNKGSILLSAHIGNWEIAGQMLEILDAKFNILIYDNEAEKMKAYMGEVMKKKNFNIIAIKDGEMGHLIELHKAFSNNEWVVMHGDRYLPGTPTIEKTFMGKKAKFPRGPFIMAAKFGVPITIVFAVKETKSLYHFFAKKSIEVKRARTEQEVEQAVNEISDKYIKELEEMVKRYPTQWFNFYDFWSEN
ncbi:MAG: lipid A biosynthesis acyltransferase [Bacteroidia bacterium]|nr:lipid A biosynthesis acyltransferase [Bacteroidia bacterium]